MNTKLAILSVLLSFGFSIQAQRYVEISAEINFVYYNPDHTNDSISAQPIHLVCVMGTNEWRIDNDYANNAMLQRYFDGTNVYTSRTIIKPISKESNEQIIGKFGLMPVPYEIAKSNIQLNVHTTIGGHPFGNEGVNLPWLAFCSGSYLRTKHRIIPPCFADLPNAPDAYAYSDKTKTFEDDLGLPTSVDLYTSDPYHEVSLNDFFHKLRGEKSKPRKGFGDGILKFHYEVLQSTNLLGWNIPVQFSFFQNDWFNGNWYLSFRGTGKTTSIRITGQPKGLFFPGKLQTIVDARFRDDVKLVNGILYQTTNGFVMPTNNADLQKIFAARVEHAPLRAPISTAHIKWGLGFFFIATTILLFVIISRQKKQTSKK